MSRKCKKCGVSKPASEFNRRFKKGRLVAVWTCRECEHRAHQIRYMENPELYRKISRNWREKNPERTQAMNYLNNGIRSGQIERPENCPMCHKKPPRGPVCGSFRGDWRNRELQWACRACRKMVRLRGEEIPVYCIALPPLPVPASSKGIKICLGRESRAGRDRIPAPLGG